MSLIPDKVAIITGGGRGIRAATARLLARHGASLFRRNYGSNQKLTLVYSTLHSPSPTRYNVKKD